MLCYSLRTLLILLAMGPPVLAAFWTTGLLPVALMIWAYAGALWLLSLVVLRRSESPSPPDEN